MLYKNQKLKEIIFPLGGIGTGSIGLTGNGELVDREILNRPNNGTRNGYSHFAVRALLPDGTSVTRVIQGDHIRDLMGQYEKATTHHGYGYGPGSNTMSGYPHFRKVTFDGRFPLATLTFTDEDFPAKITLTAFNPFIPLDADASSIPAAFFELLIHSRMDGVRYTAALSVCNPFGVTENRRITHESFTAVRMTNPTRTLADKEYGDLTVAVNTADGICQEYWYRGGWQDSVTTYWNELCTDTLTDRHYPTAGSGDTCTVGARSTIDAGKTHAFRFMLAWNVPNCYNYWNPCKNENGEDVLWKNHYASLFADSSAAAFHSLTHWDELYRKTRSFCDSLHRSTLDPAVIDAISSTLSVLKTPTVLRLADGTFYGWEGCIEKAGSCEGTCTHVWSYAYALCFLFPELERTLRDTECRYDTDEHGRMYFRTALPLGNGHVVQPPCVDGQMATVIKIYRDWKITGNTDWLREHWDYTKSILEYAWNENNAYEWDRDKDGVLEGRQHHTLDMELFGPSAWLQGMYLGALKAAAEMAAYLGDSEKQAEYETLFEKGRAWTAGHLFNGRYFIHEIDLQCREHTTHFNAPEYWNEEKNELKYQIGDGCEIDQLLGQWHANLCGLGDIFDKQQRRTALQSMFENNFVSMRDITNMWRVFALNDERGAIMCSYPAGTRKPIIPIPYCEECMTGFEYAFAGLLISEGFVEEGLRIVRAIRDRYDGEKRNPWNEIECGNNYARPMASFALLPIFSGFTFDLPRGHIGFAPLADGDFRCLWSLGTGWGDYIRQAGAQRILLKAGSLALTSISLKSAGPVKALTVDKKPIAFTQDGDLLTFAPVTAKKEICVTF